MTIKRMPLRHLSTLLAIVWMTTIFYLSSQPRPILDLGFKQQDKLLHLGAYGLLSMLILGCMSRQDSGYRPMQIAIATLLAALYGCSDEWHQSFVPGRMLDGFDLLADSLGALLGALTLHIILRARTAAQAA